jgi:hypothetical protein
MIDQALRMTPRESWRPDDTETRPRLFSEASLAPVSELNNLFVEALIDAATRPAAEVRPRLASALHQSLTQLTSAARDRLSRCPICLIDAGFGDDARWVAVATQSNTSSLGSREVVFPRLQAQKLALQTFTLAWTTARADLEGACLIFGMALSSARAIARSSIQTMHGLAERHADWLRPAWEDQPEIWHQLLTMAMREMEPQSSLSLRALQRRLADLEPATGESNEIRSTRR